jgi:hypothetical protein
MNAQILTANGIDVHQDGHDAQRLNRDVLLKSRWRVVGCPISGTGIPGGTTVAAGYNNSPNARNSSAGSATSLIASAASTADGTVTVTFTRTNFSLIGGQYWFTQGAIT